MKNYRHQKIMEIIKSQNVETQEELAELLNEAGFPVTQATISRDIKQLQLRKIPTASGKQCYAPYSAGGPVINDRLRHVLKDAFVSMDCAQNILVVKTVSGMAMAVAAAIDAIQIPKLLGCIAGDDTVMCVIRSNEDVPEVMDKLTEMTL